MKMKIVVSLCVVTLLALFSPPARAQTFSVIYSFTGSVDGKNPHSGLTIHGGALYGTTYISLDSVFELQRSGSNWSLTPLVKEEGTATARVRFGPDGHIYGTATQFNGYVYNVIPPITVCRVVNCGWKENVVYSFKNMPDGAVPGYGDVIWDQQGNMYGTTEQGGQNNGGTLWEMTPSGNGWNESVIYNFTGANGLFPYSGVVFDKNGAILGTTAYGGANNLGIVYQLNYVVGVGWKQTILHNFANAGDGQYPYAGLVADQAGNFYGVTTEGGGVVFELSPSGSSYTFNVIYNLGAFLGPFADLSVDDAGNVYGAATAGGAHSVGNVFKLTNTGNGWAYTSLHDFTGGSDGQGPISNVSIDTDGTLYGTTSAGANMNCSGGCGTVWMIKP